LLDNNILQACICGWADVLGQDYKATLFLVEKQKNEQALLFSPENMNGIFNGSFLLHPALSKGEYVFSA